MARDFATAYKKILKIAPKKLAKILKKDFDSWPPEMYWYNLSWYVNTYVKKSSKDPKSVKIYAILCDRSEKDIKAEFKSGGV